MDHSPKRRSLGKSLLHALAAVAVAGLVTVAGAGAVGSRSEAAPTNSTPPTISGSVTVGSTVTADEGTWTGSPTSFQYQWRICGADGGACRDIVGQTKKTYHIRTSDPGNTLRVNVTAVNADGSNAAVSAPSGRIATGSGPANTTPPTIKGDAAVGSTLTADPGKWNANGSVTFKYQWRVCAADGSACRDITGATGQTYGVKSEDAGNTIRITVTGSDSTGSSSSTSVPTARIGGAAPAPASAPSGCPKLAAGAEAVSVSDVAAPARLQIDQFVSSFKPIPRTMSSFTVRFHISDTCGQPVSGATVYAAGVPYNQVTTPGEAVTDGSGWVTLHFNRLSGFPAARNQELMVMFVRARKAGERLLGGISTRRLISLPVDLQR
jgi:hypothetical protein